MDDSRTNSNSPPWPAAAKDAGTSFGPCHIIEPQSEHTHTAIVLHGRGSYAEEFAQDFLASTLLDGRTLCDRLPGWRWVFPASKELWSTAFQEDMPAWFEAHSLTDPTARQDLQVDGLLASVAYVKELMEEEIERLGGDSRRLILGGISQGGAVGLWALFSQRDVTTRPGAFFAASTWLPFAADVEGLLGGQKPQSERVDGCAEAKDKVLGMLRRLSLPSPSQHTPIFIGHGVDDAYVDVELGRQVVAVLRQGGWEVEWREYSGAEEEGHWFKVPDEMDDIYSFLVKAFPA
jgi:lysophospholipase II